MVGLGFASASQPDGVHGGLGTVQHLFGRVWDSGLSKGVLVRVQLSNGNQLTGTRETALLGIVGTLGERRRQDPRCRQPAGTARWRRGGAARQPAEGETGLPASGLRPFLHFIPSVRVRSASVGPRPRPLLLLPTARREKGWRPPCAWPPRAALPPESGSGIIATTVGGIP
eukprot:gene16349-biopygen17248